ncbi:hypothetical protein MUP06_02590 [Patescibacteria group bacterium]|jgi:TRAP-type uncharacterized transport system substrate-binding protein|nr:hypothetical protein [Patescibacteria group bacterium]
MLPHCLRILTKFSLFVKKNFWLFSLGFLGISLSFSFGIIIGANIISRPPMIIEKQLLLDIEETSIKGENAEDKEFSFVASSRGKYYYPIDCSLADTLKEENKIYFKTRQEAEKGGYIYNIRCD